MRYKYSVPIQPFGPECLWVIQKLTNPLRWHSLQPWTTLWVTHRVEKNDSPLSLIWSVRPHPFINPWCHGKNLRFSKRIPSEFAWKNDPWWPPYFACQNFAKWNDCRTAFWLSWHTKSAATNSRCTATLEETKAPTFQQVIGSWTVFIQPSKKVISTFSSPRNFNTGKPSL